MHVIWLHTGLIIIFTGAWRYLNKTLVFSAWLLSLLVASFFLRYSHGINADPNGKTFMETKGGCNLNFPQEWLKVKTIIHSTIFHDVLFVYTHNGTKIYSWRKCFNAIFIFTIHSLKSYSLTNLHIKFCLKTFCFILDYQMLYMVNC